MWGIPVLERPISATAAKHLNTTPCFLLAAEVSSEIGKKSLEVGHTLLHQKLCPIDPRLVAGQLWTTGARRVDPTDGTR